ncbi:MAG: cysteine desulfurase family protein [Pseudomonadota bacterium]
MIGLDGRRVYLDWNATAPLRVEARAAMLEAMDIVGNPSSVHSEGRAAKKIIERARSQVAELLSADPAEIAFTSGATEAAATILLGDDEYTAAEIEHPCILDHLVDSSPSRMTDFHAFVDVAHSGRVQVTPKGRAWLEHRHERVLCLQAANSETGVRQAASDSNVQGMRVLCDAVQAVGKVMLDDLVTGAELALVSGHKLGAAKGVGALIQRKPVPVEALLKGGGQEQGRRSGTENVIGIAGFGAAAAAAKRDLEAGLWDDVEKLRNILEDGLEAVARDLIIFGREVPRLSNTSCFAVPGWKGETQVMSLDLAGFAVSAGSACSSGKVRESRVLRAMGYDALTASSAIRVSLGPTTTEAEIRAFLDAWTRLYRKRAERAA